MAAAKKDEAKTKAQDAEKSGAETGFKERVDRTLSDREEATGSTLFGDEVAVGNEAVPSRDIVRAAVQMSGLSVEEWNALGETEIDKRLNAVLEGMNATWRAARGSSGAVVFDPVNPGRATLRMAQAVTVHKHEEGKAPEPYSLKLGVNHDVPMWVAEHEFVNENLDKS